MCVVYSNCEQTRDIVVLVNDLQIQLQMGNILSQMSSFSGPGPNVKD